MIGCSQLGSCVCVYRTGLRQYRAPSTKPLSSMHEPSPDELPLGETERQGPCHNKFSLFVQNGSAALCCIFILHIFTVVFRNIKCLDETDDHPALIACRANYLELLSLLTGACQQQCFALIACACGCSQKIYSPCIMISVILNSPNNESACSSHRAQNSLAESHLRCCILLCSGLWVSFCLSHLLSLLSFLSPSLLLSFHIYSIGIRMMIPSSRTQLPAAHQWSSSARAGACIREEPLRIENVHGYVSHSHISPLKVSHPFSDHPISNTTALFTLLSFTSTLFSFVCLCAGLFASLSVRFSMSCFHYSFIY